MADEIEFEFDMVDGFIVWLTGLSGTGKTTIADLLDDMLANTFNIDTHLLDDDDARSKLCTELGIYKEDCDINVRRLAYVANMLAGHGVAVIVAAISPYNDIREEVKNYRTIEVYCDCPPDVVERRSSVPACTNVDPYEPPLNPDVHLHTDKETPEQSVMKILYKLSDMYDYLKEDLKEAEEMLGE